MRCSSRCAGGPANSRLTRSSPSGRRKVLFGTNYPMLSHHQALDGLDNLGLDDETRHLFLAGNAQRLLMLPVPSSP